MSAEHQPASPPGAGTASLFGESEFRHHPPGVIALTARGVIEGPHMTAMLDRYASIDEPIVSFVADLRQLKSLTREARKIRAERQSELDTQGLEVHHFVVINSVVQRAIATTLVTAVRLITRHKLIPHFVATMDEALEQARAHADRVLSNT